MNFDNHADFHDDLFECFPLQSAIHVTNIVPLAFGPIMQLYVLLYLWCMAKTTGSAFDSFDEAKWLEQAHSVDLLANHPEGWSMPIRGNVNDSWPEMPRKATGEKNEGNLWQLQQSFVHPEDVQQGLAHGVGGLRLKGHTPLSALLDGVYLNMVSIHVDRLWNEEDAHDLVKLANGLNIQGSWVIWVADETIDQTPWVEHAQRMSESFPNMRYLGCDAAQWIESGSSRIDAMVRICKTMDSILKGIQSANLDASEVLNGMVWSWSVDVEILSEIAGLRALRLLWEKWLESHHLGAIPIWIDGRTSSHSYGMDLDTDHLMLQTAGAYALVVGGADGLEVLPHDVLSGSSKEGFRWARNIQHLLKEESGLDHIFDPMGGSHTLESWTHHMLDAAWSLYQGGGNQRMR